MVKTKAEIVSWAEKQGWLCIVDEGKNVNNVIYLTKGGSVHLRFIDGELRRVGEASC